MKKSECIATVSGVTKDRIYIPAKEVVRSLEKEFIELKAKGYFGKPILLSHDYAHLLGLSQLSHVVLSDKAYLYANMFFPETKTDKELIEAIINKDMKDRLENNPMFTQISEVLKRYNITDDGIFFENSMMPAYYKKDIIKILFPDIPIDENNMLNYAYLEENFEPSTFGVFRHKKTGLVLFADKHFKRSSCYQNSYNLYFFNCLKDFYDKYKNTVKILLRIDTNSFSTSEKKLRTPIELEYWWGPHYSDDFSKLKDGISHYHMEENAGGRIYEHIDKTEFYWHDEFWVEGFRTKTFEMEEIKNKPVNIDNSQFHVFKYLHAQANLDKNTIIHFDGSVRIYNEEQYNQRISSDISQFGKNTSDYIKLFRIDGNINIEDWKFLIHNYYLNNSLVAEYFDNLKYQNQEQISETPQDNQRAKNTDDTKVIVSYEGMNLKNNLPYIEIFSSTDLLNFYTSEKTIYILEENKAYLGLHIHNPIIDYKIDFWGSTEKIKELINKIQNYLDFNLLPTEYADQLLKDICSLKANN